MVLLFSWSMRFSVSVCLSRYSRCLLFKDNIILCWCSISPPPPPAFGMNHRPSQKGSSSTHAKNKNVSWVYTNINDIVRLWNIGDWSCCPKQEKHRSDDDKVDKSSFCDTVPWQHCFCQRISPLLASFCIIPESSFHFLNRGTCCKCFRSWCFRPVLGCTCNIAVPSSFRRCLQFTMVVLQAFPLSPFLLLLLLASSTCNDKK
jgi:hypothetical protein